MEGLSLGQREQADKALELLWQAAGELSRIDLRTLRSYPATKRLIDSWRIEMREQADEMKWELNR